MRRLQELVNARGFVRIRVLLSWTLIAIGAFSLLLVAWGSLTAGMCELPNSRDAKIEIRQLEQIVSTYYLSTSPRRLPDSLKELTEGPSPLIEKVPRDPWGNDYVYIRNGDAEFEILSGGPDGFISGDRNNQ